MKKLFFMAAVLMSAGFAQTAMAQRGITVYAKGSDTPVAEAAFTQVKSLKFNMPSVVMVATDDSEMQTFDIHELERIVINDDIATAIKEVESNDTKNTDNRMYNVLGQEVSVARGIVIKNGKKYLSPKN